MREDERRVGIGQRATDDGDRVSLLEQFMPHFDTRSQHAIEVQAPAQVVFTAVEAVRVNEVRFLREFEFIRALPRVAATGRLDVPTVDAPLVLSFTRGAALLGARPPEEILAGAIGRFWRLAGNEPVVFRSPEELLAWHSDVQHQVMAAIADKPDEWFGRRELSEYWPGDFDGHSAAHRHKDLEAALEG